MLLSTLTRHPRGVIAVFAALTVAVSMSGVMPTASPASASESRTIAPTADAYVSSGAPGTAFGTESSLWIDGSPTMRSYLRFDVPSAGELLRGELLVYVNRSSQSFEVRRVADTSWQESTVTYSNAPAVGGVAVASGTATQGTWVRIDVTPLLPDSGPASLALTPVSSSSQAAYSREAGSTRAPRLVLDHAGAGAADVSAPSVMITAPASGSLVTSAQLVEIDAAASDNVGIAKVEFLDGGVIKGADTAAPFTHSWSVSSAANGPHSWTARAYDSAGNLATSLPVDVSVNVTRTAPEGALYPCVGAPAGDPGIGLGSGIYAEPRIFIEGQSWWHHRDSHAHLGACVPADQRIRGLVVTNFRLDLHNNTGYAKRLWQEVATDSCSSCGLLETFSNSDPAQFSCTSGGCHHWIKTSFNVDAADKSGWQQVQNRLEVRVADGRMRPAIRYMAYIDHGLTVDHYNRADTNGYGWHTNTAYSYARLKAATSTYSPTLPYPPVSGMYSFIASHETTTDGVSKNITGWAITLDPKLHASPPSRGTVLGEGGTSCTPYVKGTCHGPRNVTWKIDTTKLADGLHWIAIFTHQLDSSTTESTGVLKFPIVVDNVL